MKTGIIVCGVVVLFIIGVFAFKNNAPKGEMEQKDIVVQANSLSDSEEEKTESKKDAVIKENIPAPEQIQTGAPERVGSYETYSPEKIMQKSNPGNVVLFFHASWCPSCQSVDRDIRAQIKAIPTNLTILDVDYDTAQALRVKYKVTYQHTFVQVSSDGTQIKKWAGSPTLSAIIKEIQ